MRRTGRMGSLPFVLPILPLEIKMHLLVTGGAGFIGSNLIHHVIDRPEVRRLVNLDCLTYAGHLENLLRVSHHPKYTFEKADLRDKPVTIHATDATLDILRHHIFNWAIWPDFSEISIRQTAVMQYKAIQIGQKIRFGTRTITAIPAEHTVPAVGYHLDSRAGSLVCTGDTTCNDAAWPVINSIANLRYLLIETAFSNQEKRLAVTSKHLCPSMLGDELAKLTREVEIYITHLKPGQIELIMDEIQQCAGGFQPRMLQNGQVFEF